MICNKIKGSIDYNEYEHYLKPAASPMDCEVIKVGTYSREGEYQTKVNTEEIILDGIWKMTVPALGDISCDAQVPGSVHCALINSGLIKNEDGEVITDPYYGKNDKYAREASVRDYIFERKFTLSDKEALSNLRIEFGGVCERCDVSINGISLGSHTGMFGGPVYDITGKVREGENTLTVYLHGAPDRPRKENEMPTFFGGGNPWLNLGWCDTATFNCTYGWHYADIPGLGIWRSVKIIIVPKHEIRDPFIVTKDIGGDMELCCEINSENAANAKLHGCIVPKNFDGKAQYFDYECELKKGNNKLHLSFKIEEPHLWNLNGYGEQNLYYLELSVAEGETVFDAKKLQFGIRTVDMLPPTDPETGTNPRSDRYNWQFIVNGEPVFIKGTGWCTMDALMRFSRENYQKFLGIAKSQNVNMLRAWGGGLVETDEFYDLCDEYGIAVFQEWPTAWDSYVYQPEDVLLETVRNGVLRLRNRASLFIWCGGNEGFAYLEGSGAYDPEKLNKMGKLTYELDGSRPWHRQEPYGGSLHNYDASWGRQNVSVNLTLESLFFGEFGVDCWCNYESIEKFMSQDEIQKIDAILASGEEAPADSTLAHHTPMFNKADDLSREQQHVRRFIEKDSIKSCVIGSQIAQATGVRHTLERARTRYPYCTGAIMYKLNDPYPAASWSTVDYYGSPKFASYIVADSFEPTCAVAVFDRVDYEGAEADIPIFLLDDNGTVSNIEREVRINVYDEKLNRVLSQSFNGDGKTKKVQKLGTVKLDKTVTSSSPLIITSDLYIKGELHSRNWYWLNYEKRTGCLFNLPKTTIAFEKTEHGFTVTNKGNVLAVAVNFECASVSDTFRPSDNYFCLEPGESKTVKANFTAGVEGVKAWNG